MVEFKSIGHVAEVYGWKLTVRDGVAELSLDHLPNGGELNATELRALAELFAGAADLIEGKPAADPLSIDQMEALPVSK